MSTSTLDQIDLEQLMDDSPACDGKCGRDATHRVTWICGCLQLGCMPCIDKAAEAVAKLLLLAGTGVFACSLCKHAGMAANHVSEVMRVTPL